MKYRHPDPVVLMADMEPTSCPSCGFANDPGGVTTPVGETLPCPWYEASGPGHGYCRGCVGDNPVSVYDLRVRILVEEMTHMIMQYERDYRLMEASQ